MLNGVKILPVESRATAINNHNQIAGWLKQPRSGRTEFQHINYTALEYGNAGGTLGINLFLSDDITAFIWENNTFIKLGTLGGRSSQATDINDLEQVVGASLTGIKTQFPSQGQLFDIYTVHAFIWENRQMKDLNNLIINKPADVELILATAINNRGQIVGIARVGKQEHAFLLEPI